MCVSVMCVRECSCVWVYVYMHACIYVYICVYLYTCICGYTRMFMRVCCGVYMCTRVCVCEFMCLIACCSVSDSFGEIKTAAGDPDTIRIRACCGPDT